MERGSIISDIYAKWPVIWTSLLALEDVRYFSEQESPIMGRALLPTLFIVLEKVLKFRLDSIDENKEQNLNTTNKSKRRSVFEFSFSKVVHLLAEKGVLTEGQKSLLNEVRKTRNHLFHDMYESGGFVLNGKVSLASETDTHTLIYDTLSEPIFELIWTLLRDSDFPPSNSQVDPTAIS